MKRRVFNILSAASLLLCLACLVDVLWYGGADAIIVFNRPGYLDWSWHWYDIIGIGSSKGGPVGYSCPDGGIWFGVEAWELNKLVGIFKLTNGPQVGWWVGVNYWVLIVIAAVLPAIWLIKSYRRTQRRLRGLCMTCGYDLRASTERCPECGEPIPKPDSPPFGMQEFAGMSEREAMAIWQRCHLRTTWSPRLALCVFFAVIGSNLVGWLGTNLLPQLNSLLPNRTCSIVGTVVGWLLAERIKRPILRRLIRRELGIACRKCDYDLTGNVSGVCPECGTPIPLKPPASR